MPATIKAAAIVRKPAQRPLVRSGTEGKESWSSQPGDRPPGPQHESMNWHGLQFEVRNTPTLDKEFWPMAAILRAHQKSARAHGGKEIAIGIEQPEHQHSVYRMLIHNSPDFSECDQSMVERVVKFLLWMKGGHKIVLYGDEKLGDFLKVQYLPFGIRGFDAEFMGNVYGEKFLVRNQKMNEIREERTKTHCIGGNETGFRIGLHIGVSDRDAASVVDGRCIYSNEVLWEPLEHTSPEYHYRGIVESMRDAAGHMDRVDSIGVSASGIYVNNECRVARLFSSIPETEFDTDIRDIFIRAAKEIGAPLRVENDGDVAALAGAMSIGENNVLGVSMGTSESAGYVNEHGHLNTWLNELAGAPVDLSPFAGVDSWSKGKGVGSLYFSQAGVIRLAETAGISFAPDAKPVDRLQQVQELMEKEDPAANRVFTSLGVYWGHTLALYHHFYRMRHVLMLGRALSGCGGDVICSTASKVLKEEYPEAAHVLRLHIPDEDTRRVGQSVAAASL